MTATREHGSVYFDDLLDHYCNAYQGLEPGQEPDSERLARQANFREMLAAFEATEGTIKSQAWCANVRAGAILTSRTRYYSAGNAVGTKADLDLAQAMTEIDRMARRAQDLLWNPMKRNSLEQLFAVKATVLDGLDRLADDELTADEKSALRNLTEVRVAADLKVATDYTESAIRRRSQLLYLGGMVGGVLVVGLVTWIVANLVRAPGLVAGMDTIPTTLFLGGLGAIVSVMQRLTRGRLRTSLDNGQIVCILLGAFRPAIGAVMAVAILLLTLGGIIPLDVPGDAGQRLYFLGGLAFLAGFSERFAQDMIATARGVGSGAGSAETAEEA